VDVTVIGDLVRESDETFQVNLSNPTGGAVIADGQGIGTILTDDTVSPCVSIKDVAVLEGDSGKSLAIFSVTLSSPTDQQVTVNFTTTDGTATIANNDYQFTSGTLTIPAKSTSANIAVNINGDSSCEPDEVFNVILSGAVNATLCSRITKGVGTIVNDDCITATLLSQFAVEAVEDGIALRWQFGDPSSIKTSWVERADAPTGPWAKVEAEVTPEDGMLTMLDRSVEAEHTYHYRLAAVLNNGQTLRSGSIAATAGEIVREFALTRISPNPANGPARIDYAVPQQSKVRLSVLDVQGRVVAVLVDGVVKAGRHQAVWSGQMTRGTAAAGMYFVRYEAGGKSFVKRVVLMQ